MTGSTTSLTNSTIVAIASTSSYARGEDISPPHFSYSYYQYSTFANLCKAKALVQPNFRLSIKILPQLGR